MLVVEVRVAKDHTRDKSHNEPVSTHQICRQACGERAHDKTTAWAGSFTQQGPCVKFSQVARGYLYARPPVPDRTTGSGGGLRCIAFDELQRRSIGVSGQAVAILVASHDDSAGAKQENET